MNDSSKEYEQYRTDRVKQLRRKNTDLKINLGKQREKIRGLEDKLSYLKENARTHKLEKQSKNEQIEKLKSKLSIIHIQHEMEMNVLEKKIQQQEALVHEERNKVGKLTKELEKAKRECERLKKEAFKKEKQKKQSDFQPRKKGKPLRRDKKDQKHFGNYFEPF